MFPSQIPFGIFSLRAMPQLEPASRMTSGILSLILGSFLINKLQHAIIPDASAHIGLMRCRLAGRSFFFADGI